jgi:hypothetical protein
MSLNGKRDDYTVDDLIRFADICDIKTKQAKDMIIRVNEVVEEWDSIAEDVGVFENDIVRIKKTHRLDLKIL